MSGNTVNSNNFNLTMDGYISRAFKYVKQNYDFNEKNLKEFEEAFYSALRWSKDEMTMQDARNEAK